jgi:hypothetical protein
MLPTDQKVGGSNPSGRASKRAGQAADSVVIRPHWYPAMHPCAGDIFYINVPIGLAVLGALPSVVPTRRTDRPSRRIDLGQQP